MIFYVYILKHKDDKREKNRDAGVLSQLYNLRRPTKNILPICIHIWIDLGTCEKIWVWILPIQAQSHDIQIQDSPNWNWCTLFKVTKIKNQMFWILFTHSSSRRKMDGQNSILLKFMTLDIYILDLTIWSRSKHLKTPTN